MRFRAEVALGLDSGDDAARPPRPARARLPRPDLRHRGLARRATARDRRPLVAPRARRGLRAGGPLDPLGPAPAHGSWPADGPARVALPGGPPRDPRRRRLPGPARAPRGPRRRDPPRRERALPARRPLALRGGSRDRRLRVPRLVPALPAAPGPGLDPRLPAPRRAALRPGAARGAAPRRGRAPAPPRLGQRALALRRG